MRPGDELKVGILQPMGKNSHRLDFSCTKIGEVRKLGSDMLQTTVMFICLSRFHQIGITEGELRANQKHVWSFAYSLRKERGTVLILTWLTDL